MRHHTLAHNFTKYKPIFELFFIDGLSSKFATKLCLNIPHALNMSLHYLVKYEWQKNVVNLKYVL